MSRISETFARLHGEGRTGLIAYVPTGFPSLDATPAIVAGLIDGGADIVELGVPFSDPLADGATIQRATFQALQQGVTLRDCLDTVRQLRGRFQTPFVLMGYLNPLLSFGLERFFDEAAAAGVDGLIVVDATLDEAGDLRRAASGSGIDLIQLVAPTTSEERLASLLPSAQGFVYCVSVAGTTGAREGLPPALPALIARVKRWTDLPVAVGFGVSRPEHVAFIGKLCEAAAIGSAIVAVIESAPPDERVERVREYVEEVTGRRRAPGLR